MSKLKWKIGNVLVVFGLMIGTIFMPVVIDAETVNVASINGKEFATLVDAVGAAQEGDEIEMISDTFVNRVKLQGNKKIVIDLNGHTIYGADKLGEATKYVFQIEGDSSLTIKDSSSSKDGLVKGVAGVVLLNRAKFTLESGTIQGSDYAITGNADEKFGIQNTTINIKGGKVLQVNPNDFETAAIYHPQAGNINMSGGIVEGNVGIQLCSGSLNTVSISDGQVIGTGINMIENKQTDGPIGDGAAVSIVNRNYPGGIPKVNITGGSYVSKQSKAVMAYAFNLASTPKASVWEKARDYVKISKGSFSTNPQEYVSDGYKTYSVNNQFVVAPKATGITLSDSNINLQVNETFNATATVAPMDSLEPITWESSNPEIAKVDSNGKITGVSTGRAYILAKADNQEVSLSVVVTNLVAKPPLPNVDFTKPSDKVVIGVADENAKQIFADASNTVIEAIANGENTTMVDAKTYDAIKEAIYKGSNIDISIKMDMLHSSEVNVGDKDKVEKLINVDEKVNANVAQYIDISVLLKADGKVIGALNELGQETTFTIALPQDLIKENRSYYIVRVHDGVAQRLTTKMNADGTMSFKTDRFSTYALVYEEAIETSVQTPSNPNGSKTVNTGDNTSVNTYLLLTIGSLSLIAMLRLKRKFIND